MATLASETTMTALLLPFCLLLVLSFAGSYLGFVLVKAVTETSLKPRPLPRYRSNDFDTVHHHRIAFTR